MQTGPPRYVDFCPYAQCYFAAHSNGTRFERRGAQENKYLKFITRVEIWFCGTGLSWNSERRLLNKQISIWVMRWLSLVAFRHLGRVRCDIDEMLVRSLRASPLVLKGGNMNTPSAWSRAPRWTTYVLISSLIRRKSFDSACKFRDNQST